MSTDLQTCYRHTDRRAGVRCQRCERPICPSCMTQASVGFHCPECLRGSHQQVVTARQLRSQPVVPVTTALIALNVAVYLFSALDRGLSGPGLAFLSDYALIGSGRTMAGAVGVEAGEWYRLVTGGFLHGSLLHLFFNMYVLLTLGRQLEPALGRVGFGAVYLSSLLAGSLGVMFVEPTSPTVGASGAVFGLFGYLVVAQWLRGVNPMHTGLGGVVIINLLFTFLVPGISVGGHVGGLLGGAACGLLLETVRTRRISLAVGAGGVFALGLLFAATAVVTASA